MRVLDTYLASRQARAAIERLLDMNDHPRDRVLSLAITRLVLIEEQALRALDRIAEWRVSA